MFDYAKIILLFLQLAERIFDYAEKQGYISEGQQLEIARASTAVLAKTSFAKGVREKIASLDDVAVANALRNFEPKTG